jgi:predicted aminopeptidase
MQNSLFDFRSVAAVLALSAVLLSGCSTLYVLRAAYEEGKILWRRQPIAAMLEDPALQAETREKLELVLAVRDYARDTLKFRVNGSYASYSYVDRSALSYVVMAVPKTSLVPHTWWFPVVGRVPYKGFFSEQAAKGEAGWFEARGYDTYIRTTPAFSTLGWFDDPVLAHLLRYDRVTLAATIFHELFHNTLFVKGGVDFNESLANFFGNRAAIHFFRDRFGEQSPERLRAEQIWREDIEFSKLITRMAISLRKLYGRELPPEEKLRLRDEIFWQSQRAWGSEIADRPGHRFRGFSEQRLNGAVMVHYLLYFTELELFEALYDTHGRDLEKTAALIKNSLGDASDPFAAVRRLVATKRS